MSSSVDGQWGSSSFRDNKRRTTRSENIIIGVHRGIYPPSLLIIKKETQSESPMFNLLLCKPFEGWLYCNCSLVLYIYRCTLCQGQGDCVGFFLSFQGSISGAIWETGRIELVLTWPFDGPGLQVAPREPFLLIWWDALWNKPGKRCNMLTNCPQPLLPI